MLQSARQSNQTPRQLSFSAAVQAIAVGWQVIVLTSDPVAARLIQAELENLADHLVGNRPVRTEPRPVKRRPKPHDLPIEPRAPARAELIRAASP